MRIYTPDPNSPLYFLEDEETRISYMTEALAERMQCSAVPMDTVTFIHISFYGKKRALLSELGIDEAKFETFDAASPQNIGFKAYVNSSEGIYICTLDAKVTGRC
jgi:hypothetical protein